jgi:hypothetical protein
MWEEISGCYKKLWDEEFLSLCILQIFYVGQIKEDEMGEV